MVKSLVNDYSQITVINSDYSKCLYLKKKNKDLKKANKFLQKKIDSEYIHIREFKKMKSILQKQIMRFKFNRFLNFSRKKKSSLKEKNQSQNKEEEEQEEEEQDQDEEEEQEQDEEVEQEEEEQEQDEEEEQEQHEEEQQQQDQEEQEQDEEEQEQHEEEQEQEEQEQDEEEQEQDEEVEQVEQEEEEQNQNQQELPVVPVPGQLRVREQDKIVNFQESFSEKFQSFLLLILVVSIVFAVLTNDTTHLFKYIKSFIIMFHWEKIELSQILPILFKHTGISVLIAMVYYGIISIF
jgi:hypothetical protein